MFLNQIFYFFLKLAASIEVSKNYIKHHIFSDTVSSTMVKISNSLNFIFRHLGLNGGINISFFRFILLPSSSLLINMFINFTEILHKRWEYIFLILH